MHERLSRNLTRWKLLIFEVGIFVFFVVTFGEFILRKLWAVLGPLLR